VIQTDIIVIGAGMAGASVAAHLAETQRVVLVEREERAGYHATGRSAALFTEIYGNPVIRALTRASRRFLFDPVPGFADSALTHPRGCLYIATAEQLEALRRFAALPDIAPATRPLSATEARALCPILREGYVAGALLEPDSSDIEVHGLHHGYLRLFRRRNGRFINNAAVAALEHDTRGWTVRAGAESLRAPVIVNAAGAWADEIAGLAGITPIGLVPRRRTALLVDPPPGIPVDDWPFVNDIDEQFYFKPDAGSLFISPADETATLPGDAQPDEWDIAVAVDRVQAATTLQIHRLKARWAGLRTFAPDRSPVVGFAPDAEGFFWLAGQGGYGIQTAPALSRAAAALLRGLPLPQDLVAAGVLAADISPLRFRASRA
jgi:D-arginine dehydrogenase